MTQPSPRRRDRRRHTAVHEAGHAVVGRVLMLVCGSVTIKANRAEMEAGFAVIADSWVTVEWWQRIGRYREATEYRSAVIGRVITHMAGAEAEAALLGVCSGCDGSDRREITMMLDSLTHGDADEAERLEARLRCFARQLVRRHVGKVEALARALWTEGTIAEDEAVRAAAGLPPAPPGTELWREMMEAEVTPATSLIPTPTAH